MAENGYYNNLMSEGSYTRFRRVPSPYAEQKSQTSQVTSSSLMRPNHKRTKNFNEIGFGFSMAEYKLGSSYTNKSNTQIVLDSKL